MILEITLPIVLQLLKVLIEVNVFTIKYSGSLLLRISTLIMSLVSVMTLVKCFPVWQVLQDYFLTISTVIYPNIQTLDHVSKLATAPILIQIMQLLQKSMELEMLFARWIVLVIAMKSVVTTIECPFGLLLPLQSMLHLRIQLLLVAIPLLDAIPTLNKSGLWLQSIHHQLQ